MLTTVSSRRTTADRDVTGQEERVSGSRYPSRNQEDLRDSQKSDEKVVGTPPPDCSGLLLNPLMHKVANMVT